MKIDKLVYLFRCYQAAALFVSYKIFVFSAVPSYSVEPSYQL